MPFYRLFYHVVWTTKGRASLINEANCSVIFSAINDKVSQLGGTVYALNGMDDHVHLVCSIPTNVAVGTFIGQVKGTTSHLAGKLSTESFTWQSEYGIISVSENQLGIVIAYVENQQRHHSTKTLNKTLETIS
jgi:putative transposase